MEDISPFFNYACMELLFIAYNGMVYATCLSQQMRNLRLCRLWWEPEQLGLASMWEEVEQASVKIVK